MLHRHFDSTLCGMACALALLTAGCATPRSPAPVEERTPGAKPAVVPAPAPTPAVVVPVPAAPEPARPLPGIENAGKPGFYTIKPGDTMIRIGLETGQNWKDLVKWNNLENPNLIEVGQVLRVVPPGTDPGTVARPITPARVETKGLDGKPVAGAASTPAPAPAASTAPGAAGTPGSATTAAAVREGDEELAWQWPAAGPLLSGFEEGKVKGLTIAGKAGDPVLAAAEGKVVYAGSGLRGYGNLVILKHNNTFLTAYAHNQALLVKEDQTVKRGQKIAEMGSTDAERVQLHFEIRRQGKPIDPARLLPPR
jgi:lipoprotein NlpD